MTRIIVHDFGSGPPLVVLHAFPLTSTLWAAQLDALAGMAQVLAPDLPGFGASAAVEMPADLDAIARMLYEELQAQGVQQAVVAGCSMGGYLAFALLRIAPALVRGLALVNTKASVDSEQGRLKRFELAQRVEREGCSFLIDEWPQGALAPSTLRTRPQVVDAVKQMIAQATPQGVIAAQHAMAARPDSTPLLRTIAVPTVIIHGLDDPIIPVQEARTMASSIGGASFVGVPDAGHLPPLEQPDLVHQTLRALLDDVARR